MDFDKEKIVEALRPINMPGTSQDLVTMGGVRNVEVDGRRIHIEAVVFTPALNMRRKVENQIKYLVEKLYPEAEVSATVGSEKPHRPDRDFHLPGAPHHRHRFGQGRGGKIHRRGQPGCCPR